MSTSYERINYNLRPAKSVERKMLCEAFRRLLNFYDLTKYRYVGFGSIFFSDFTLIHKSLGIKDLISIEKETKDKKRFEFNCPYKCVKLRFGDANDVLPNLSWRRRLILWLDYDYRLNGSMFVDISTFFSRARSGNIILLTMEVTPYELHELNKKTSKYEKISRYEKLKETIGASKIPLGVKEKDLDRQGFPRVCYNIINNEIDQIFSIKNSVIENNKKLIYKQLFNFRYQDGDALMLTVGGIIYSQKDKKKIQECNFEDLDFIKSKRNEYKPYEINVPNLTFREMRYLDKILPRSKSPKIKKEEYLAFLSEEKQENYSKIYRYFPTFVEAEIR